MIRLKAALSAAQERVQAAEEARSREEASAAAEEKVSAELQAMQDLEARIRAEAEAEHRGLALTAAATADRRLDEQGASSTSSEEDEYDPPADDSVSASETRAPAENNAPEQEDSEACVLAEYRSEPLDEQRESHSRASTAPSEANSAEESNRAIRALYYSMESPPSTAKELGEYPSRAVRTLFGEI